MINIVYIIPCFKKGGPVNVVYDIIKNIDRNIFNVSIIALRKEKGYLNAVEVFKLLGVSIFEYNYKNYQIALFPHIIAQRILKDIDSLENVVIHSHCHWPNMICKHISGYPKMTTVHNISIEDYVNGLGPIVGKYLSKQYNHALKRFDISVVISEYMMEYYSKFVKNAVKISNGVGISCCKDFNVTVFKQQCNIPENTKVILILGMLIPRKNVEYAIKALKAVSMDFTCLIIGNGPSMESCKNIVNNDKRFRFEGFKNNIVDYFSIADLYISSSLSEGLPLAVLEAVNCGVPCLLSNIRPHAEIVQEINECGVICFELEKNELATKVTYSLSNCYDHERIAQKAHSIYSSEVMAHKYEEVYLNIINTYEPN